jgi:hypothetical protein
MKKIINKAKPKYLHVGECNALFKNDNKFN